MIYQQFTRKPNLEDFAVGELQTWSTLKNEVDKVQ